MTWWPPNIPGPSYRADSVEQILFSFYDGALYKMSVTLRSSVDGRSLLEAGDMVKSISAKYGPSTTIAPTATMPRRSINTRPRGASSPRGKTRSILLTLSIPRLPSASDSCCTRSLPPMRKRSFRDRRNLEAPEAGRSARKGAERQKKQSDDIEAAQRGKPTNVSPLVWAESHPRLPVWFCIEFHTKRRRGE